MKNSNYTRESLCNELHRYWRYICVTFQVLAAGFVAFIFLSMFTGYVTDVSVLIEFAGSGGGGPPESPPHHPSLLTPYNKGPPPLYTEQFAALLDHDRDSDDISDDEEELIREIFDQYDVDGDELLDLVEFGTFVTQTLQTDETFNTLDIGGDGLLNYGELVAVLDVLLGLLSDEDTSDDEYITGLLQEIFGDTFEEDDKAEFMGEVFFQALDTDGDGSVTPLEYRDFEINQEWTEYNQVEGEYIDFNEFLLGFFGSNAFKNLQKGYNNFISSEAKTRAALLQIEELRAQKAQGIDLELHLKFAPHALDDEITTETSRRRMFVFWIAAIYVAAFVIELAIITGVEICIECCSGDCGCYDYGSTVYDDAMNAMIISDISVGDYVFDGNGGYTKVFYLPEQVFMAKMMKIKFGIPMNHGSITLTPHHLVYKDNEVLPVRSDTVKIGDILFGFNDDNYTVYDIDTVYRKPINPITMSGDLVVNNIKTSVFTHSIQERDRLMSSGAVLRWFSNNIDEQLAVAMADFSYNQVYRSLPNGAIKDWASDNAFNASIFCCSVAVIPMMLIVSAVQKAFKIFN